MEFVKVIYHTIYIMSKFIAFFIIFSSLTLASHSSNISEENPQYFNDLENVFCASSELFTSQVVPDNIYEKMLGKSIPLEYKNKVDKNSLSYLQISYYSFDGLPHLGEMIVNSKVSNEVLDIFKELYDIKYPIEKIKLIDEYNANDELSMADNNTSCFCYRVIANTSSISNHAKGLAIDINPLYNPYVVNGSISPVSGSLYADRSLNHQHQINKNDALYKIFTKHRLVLGWRLVWQKGLSAFRKKIVILLFLVCNFKKLLAYSIFISLFPSVTSPISYAISPSCFNISNDFSTSSDATIIHIPIPILKVLYISLSGIFPSFCINLNIAGISYEFLLIFNATFSLSILGKFS